MLVDKINIATQWHDRIESALGYKTGTIGDGIWYERNITIALRQTLWARIQQLDAQDWWENWGVVILDECHQISAPTLQELIQRFPAYFRIGLSATPDRHNYLTIISRSTLGEIFCRTSEKELEDAGVLVRPRIVAVRTPFKFKWNKKADARKQYSKMLKELKFDEARNTLFGKILATQRGHCCLVHTEHIKHAHELAAYALAYGWPDDKVFMMTSAENDEKRQAIIRHAADGDCLIFSTIAKEALDIPRLNRFFLPFPMKNEAMVKQIVGRLRRTHVEKTEAPILYDFYDHNIRQLSSQFDQRRGVYDREKLDLSII